MNDSIDLDDNEQLREALQDLKAQNYQLKSSLTDSEFKLQQALQDYSKIKGEIGLANKKYDLETNSKIEDLERRMKILMQTNEELKTKNEQIQESANKYLNTETDRLKKQYTLDISKLEKTLKEKENQISVLQESLTKTKNQQISQNATITRLIDQLKVYFNAEFLTVDNVITFLNQPKAQDTVPAQVKELISSRQIVSDNEKTIKDLYRQLRNLESINRSKDEELDSLTKHYEAAMTNQIQKSQAKIKQLELQISNQKVETIVQIKKKDAPLAQSKSYRSKSSQTEEQKVQTVPLTQFQKKEDEIVEKDKTILTLNNKISDLSSKISQLEKERLLIKDDANQICNNVEKKIKDIQMMQKDLSEAENELIAEKDKNYKLNLTVDGLNKQIANLKCDLDIADTKIKSLLDSIEAINKMLEDKNEETKDLCRIRDNLLGIISKQNNMLETQDHAVETIAAKLRDKKNSPIKVQKQEELTFDFTGYPTELVQLLTNIVENDALEPNSRLKSVLRIISKWIGKIEGQNRILKETSEKNSYELQKSHNNFLDSLKAIIGEEEITEQQIPEEFQKLANDCQKFKEERDSYGSKLNSLLISLKQNSLEQVIDTFNKQRQQIQKLNVDLENEKQQRANDSEYYKNRMRQSKSKREHLAETIACLEEANQNCKVQIEEQNHQIEILQQQNEQIISTFTEQKEQDDEDDELKLDQNHYDELITIQKMKYNNLEAQTSKQIEKLSGEKRNLELELATTINQLRVLEERNSKLKDDFDNLLTKYNESCIVLRQNEVKMKGELEKNLSDMKSKYEKINSLHESHAEKANDLVKELSEKLKVSESQINEMKSQISELNLKLRKEEINGKVQAESFERSKQLIEAQTKAKLVIFDTNNRVKIDELKHEHEQDMRNLYGYFAENFGSFYDASQQLNEESFQKLVLIIKKELEKARKQDLLFRKFLNAHDLQSTEDAMTSFIIDNHPSLKI